MPEEVQSLVDSQFVEAGIPRTSEGFRSVFADVQGTYQDSTEAELRKSTELYGWTCLRFLPADEVKDGLHLVGIAEIETEFAASRVPSLMPAGIQVLNSRSVFGAFYESDGYLRLRTQYSIYEQEPASQLAAALIVKAFNGHLPFGFATARAQFIPDALVKHRAHLDAPRMWRSPVEPAGFEEGARKFRDAGLLATPGPTGICLEVPLSGDCPSRSYDPRAETALLMLETNAPHPLAGVGYVATIALPVDPIGEELVEVCRELNAFEMRQGDFVPRYGAWGVRGLDDELVYAMFLPTSEAWGLLHNTILNWNVQRAIVIRDLFWEEGRGISLNRLKSLRATR
jgi:hypothetical protein